MVTLCHWLLSTSCNKQLNLKTSRCPTTSRANFSQCRNQKTVFSSPPLLSTISLLFSALPSCLLELSLESDLHYLSLTRSPRLCLFLCLNGDLDKRVWAAREQPLNTKRQKSGRKERPEQSREQGARFTLCFRLIMQLHTSCLFIRRLLRGSVASLSRSSVCMQSDTNRRRYDWFDCGNISVFLSVQSFKF